MQKILLMTVLSVGLCLSFVYASESTTTTSSANENAIVVDGMAGIGGPSQKYNLIEDII